MTLASVLHHRSFRLNSLVLTVTFMFTAIATIDEEAIVNAYDDVRDEASDTSWWIDCCVQSPSPPLPSPSPNLPPLRPRFPCVTQLFIQTVHHVRYLKVIIIIIIIIIIKSCNRHSSSYYISTDVKHKVILAQFFIAWEVPRSTRETENSAVAHVTSFESLRSGKFWKSLHPISHYLFVREPSVKVYLW